MMKDLFKLEWYKIRYTYMMSLIIGVLYSIIIIIPFTSGYSYNHTVEIWQQSNELFTLIFPLIAVIPTCWLMYYERKNNFLVYTLTRISKKKYILSKWITTAIGSAIIIFSISFTGLIFSLVFLKNIQLTGIELQGHDTSLDQFFGYYLVNKPYLYGFILSVWRGLIGFLIATLGFVLSLYGSNIFVVLTGPFIYTVLENYILSMIDLPYYRLVTSFDPSILSAQVISVERILIGPLILSIFICSIYIYYSIIKKEKIYEI